MAAVKPFREFPPAVVRLGGIFCFGEDKAGWLRREYGTCPFGWFGVPGCFRGGTLGYLVLSRAYLEIWKAQLRWPAFILARSENERKNTVVLKCSCLAFRNGHTRR